MNGQVHQKKRKSRQKKIYSTEETTGSIASDLGQQERDQNFQFDENEPRGNWTSRPDYIFTCLGHSIGLGNLWRFPYLCHQHGGGSFLIAYLILWLLVGIPLYFLEASLGQFASAGVLSCWKFGPVFTGIGAAMLVISSLVAIYYNVVLSWSLYYLFASFRDELPWSSCSQVNHLIKDRVSERCTESFHPICENGTTGFIRHAANGTCYNESTGDFVGYYNHSGYRFSLPSDIYWKRQVLSLSNSLEEIGPVKWELALCLLLAWIFVFIVLVRGVKSLGKAAYVTATMPYILLLILGIRAWILPDHLDGITFFGTPTLEGMSKLQLWNDAGEQLFYSLLVVWGGTLTLSSYNRFFNHSLRDSLVVSFINTVTLIVIGFVIYAYLGFMASEIGTSAQEAVESGPGFIFTVFTFASTRMKVSALWSIFFFLMLFIGGLNSQFVLVETIVTAIVDQFEKTLRPKKILVALALCIAFYLMGLTFVTEGGIYLLKLMDNYVSSWNALFIGSIECIALAGVYGWWDRFNNDIKCMIGSKPIAWWNISWLFIAPGFMLAVMILGFISWEPTQLYDYRYSAWADALGWLASFASVVVMLFVALYFIFSQGRGKYSTAFKPSEEWGPALPRHRTLVVEYVNNFVIDPNPDCYEAQLEYAIRPFHSEANLAAPKSESELSEPKGTDKEYSNEAYVE